MKKIAFLVLSLIPLIATAQEHNFSLKDGGLIWRKVYAKETDNRAVEQALRSSGCFREINVTDSLVTAELHGLALNYKDLGYRRMSVPLYVSNDTFSALVTVQARPGRYRVTVERIVTHNANLGDSSLETLAVRNGALTEAFLATPAKIIEYNFDILLSNLCKKDDDEW